MVLVFILVLIFHLKYTLLLVQTTALEQLRYCFVTQKMYLKILHWFTSNSSLNRRCYKFKLYI